MMKKILMVTAVAVLMVTSASAQIIYVDITAGGANNGNSWTDARTSLQSALGVAVSGDQIWIADGVYKPGAARTSTFQMIDGVEMYGGFAGGETLLSQRDPWVNFTVLSGDLSSNDTGSDDLSSTTNHPNRNDNVYHVLTGVNNAVLDSLWIVGGYANDIVGVDPEWRATAIGGGLDCLSTRPTVRNCFFADNYAYAGGAVHINNNVASFEDCGFSGNWSSYGGAAFLSRGQTIFDRCYFAGGHGGANAGVGFMERGGSPIIKNSVLVGNMSTIGGGALRINGSSGIGTNNCQIVSCTFSGNQSQYFGAISGKGGAPFVTNCIMWGDESTEFGEHEEIGQTGGGWIDVVYSDVPASPPGNYSLGAGCFNLDAQFNGGPTATISGMSFDSPTHIATITASGQSWGVNQYRGMSVSPSTNTPLQYIIIGNGADTLVVAGAPDTFADIGDTLQIHDYRLGDSSPCIDIGIAAGLTNDFHMAARPQGPAAEMGAFELPTVDVTLATVPAGLKISMDSVTNDAPYAYSITTGQTAIAATAVAQDDGAGRLYTWSHWSDAGLRTNEIVADAVKTITAYYSTQYQFSVSINPPGSGTVSPTDGSWHAPGSSPNAIATPNSGWVFSNWTGDVTGTATNPVVPMDGPKTCVANFAAQGTVVTIDTAPVSLDVIVDGITIQGGTAFSWGNGSVHTIEVATVTQERGLGTRHSWTNWSDTGGQSHEITVTGTETITANFDTEYYWEAKPNVPRAGTITPSNGWYAPMSSFTATATPLGAWTFRWWEGDMAGTNTDLSITMSNAISVTAFFDVPTVAGVIYVDQTAVGEDDGTSWLNAYVDLSTALGAAGPGEEVWVAEGTYLPGVSRDSSFGLKTDVAIYGGFDGLERTLDERDLTNNLTVLSGDLNGDDTAGFSNRSDNAYNVVKADSVSRPVIDGFVIRGGYSDDIFGWGGGMLLNNVNGSATVQNCIFVDNVALTNGGGMCIRKSDSVLVADCIFSGNRSLDVTNDGGSGALGLEQHDDPAQKVMVERCIFTGNMAEKSVGAATFTGTDSWPITWTNCLFAGNYSGWLGGNSGTLHTRELGSMIVNCTFAWNYPYAVYDSCTNSTEIVSGNLWRNVLGQEYGLVSGEVRYSNIDDGSWLATYENSNVDPEWRFTTNGSWEAGESYDAELGVTTLVDNDAEWKPDELAGYCVDVGGGAPTWMQFYIKGNTETTIDVWGDATPLAGLTSYDIYDYHLKYTSPIIDTGDPTADYSLEPDGGGGRINRGVWGGTSQAATTNPPPIDLDGTLIMLYGNEDGYEIGD